MKNQKYLFILILIFSSASYAQLEDFRQFSQKFYSDSVFQKDRIKFPIRKIQTHLKDHYYTIDRLTQREWYYTEVDSFRIDSLKPFRIDSIKLKSESRIEAIYKNPWRVQHSPLPVTCYRKGIIITHAFLPINGNWFLTFINYQFN